MYFILLLFCLFTSAAYSQTGEINGRIFDSSDNSYLSNCNVSVVETSTGTVSGKNGTFKLILPFGEYTLKVTHLGYQTFEKKVILDQKNKTVTLIIELTSTSIISKEVTVTGERDIPSTIVQGIKPKDIERMPVIYNDVLRAVQVLPGVSSNNELSSGYNVRGGNFDDNLIYLNGFEIYRPFLLRQGVEENKTLINPDLVSSLRFYNGSFPASYGDKMSSALEVNYDISRTENFSGTAHIDFLNTGITVKDNFKGLKYGAGFRYSNPGLFLNSLQTNGDYKPHFIDFQLISQYSFSEAAQLEIFLLLADNKFDLSPTDWLGHFGGYHRGDYRALEIFYEGERTYSFKTRLYGANFSYLLNDNVLFDISGAGYLTTESEYSNIQSDYYYLANAEDSGKEFLRSASEHVNNHLDLSSYEFIPRLKIKADDHLITTGFNIRLTDVLNKMNEQYVETNDSLIKNYPDDRFIDRKFNLNSLSYFIQDEFNIKDIFFVNAGARLNYYTYNEEFIVSPRVSIIFPLSEKQSFSMSWGYYFQPPYYAELRNKINPVADKILSQKAVHYSAGWEYSLKGNLKFNIEGYYKKLDDIIPYYIDREKTEYAEGNFNEGYAFGFDMMVQGEVVDGMNSWLGYGYLDTKERPKSGGSYTRRLTDQTHTVQIFLQDRIKKHPNWQSHFRLLFGSGYLYNLREIVQDEGSSQRYIKISMIDLREYFMYFRADMGLSASFDIGNYDLVIVAEVLNLFDHRNFGGYRFVQVSKEIAAPFAIPQILSSRFFNIGVEFKF